MPTYKCIVCYTVTSVSDAYHNMAYVQAQCCSVHCADKVTSNPQCGVESIIIKIV